MPRASNKVLACRALGIHDLYEPTVRIKQLLKLKLDESISYLRTSPEETAQFICALYDRLDESLRSAIDIDYLIAAAHCKDSYKVFGLICETYAKAKTIQTKMIASQQSPLIMTKRAKFAKEPKGFNDAKMILQSTGSVPVPRNQVNYLFGNNNSVDQSQNKNITSHEDVTCTVDEIVRQLAPEDVIAKLTIDAESIQDDVSSSEDSGEEDGSREEDQEDAD